MKSKIQQKIDEWVFSELDDIESPLNRSYVKSKATQLAQEIVDMVVEEIEEEKMNLELLNNARINGKFKRLDMKESIGWNKALNEIINLLKK
jgi:hypothetical protein